MLGKRLSELREKSGLSQKELSSRLGMARTTYSGYENGSREPDHNTLQKFADYFEVSVDYLLGRTEDKKRVLQDHSRKLIDLLDQHLTDEEIYQAFNEKFLVGGIPVSKEEALFFISYIRTKRAMQSTLDHSSSGK